MTWEILNLKIEQNLLWLIKMDYKFAFRIFFRHLSCFYLVEILFKLNADWKFK